MREGLIERREMIGRRHDRKGRELMREEVDGERDDGELGRG